MADFLKMDGLQAEIQEYIGDLTNAAGAVRDAAEPAAMKAAEVVQREQRRLLSKEFPHLAEHIKIHKLRAGRYKYKLSVGYDTATIRENPELLVIEFGRPGKSPRRSKPTDSIGRKKGIFPKVTPHIRAGAFLAEDEAAQVFADELFGVLKEKLGK